MKQISDLIGKYMAVIVLVVAALALFVPGSCMWVQTSWINTLLMIVMFGMGLTLKIEDFMSVHSAPLPLLSSSVPSDPYNFESQNEQHTQDKMMRRKPVP